MLGAGEGRFGMYSGCVIVLRRGCSCRTYFENNEYSVIDIVIVINYNFTKCTRGAARHSFPIRAGADSDTADSADTTVPFMYIQRAR